MAAATAARAVADRAPGTPRHVLLFGAGASFGSDKKHLYDAKLLPPLGKDLFAELHADDTLLTWSSCSGVVQKLFADKGFEVAMTELDSDVQWMETSLKRDLDLSRYFAKFKPRSTNLYWKLARAISLERKRRAWQGAVITLNYDRMLEVALHRNSVFTAVRGVTFYDTPLPVLADGQIIEMCYPHGACQFFWGQHSFVGTGNVVFGPESRLVGDTGANHILLDKNVPRACDEQHFPMIRRYQSDKRPSVGNYFLDEQLARMAAIVEGAQTIAIVGVYCAHTTDTHLWGPLAKTHAQLHYFEPFESSRRAFAEWAVAVGKREGEDFDVHATSFRDGFELLKRVSGIRE